MRSILYGKQRELFLASSSSDFDAFLVTETWLQADVVSTHFFDDEIFTVFRSDRMDPAKSRGGGVLCAVSLKYQAHKILLPKLIADIVQIDLLGVSILFNGLTIKLFIVYIPPDITRSKQDIFIYFLAQFEAYLISLDCQILIAGDFNLPDLQSNISNTNVKISRFNNFLAITNLKQINNILNCDKMMLDLILTSLSCSVSHAIETLVSIDKYHPPLAIEVNCNSRKRQSCTNAKYDICKFNFNKIHTEQFKIEICSVNWNCLEILDDVDQMCERFYDVLYSILSKTCPIRSLNKYRYSYIVTSKIIKYIKLKNWHREKYKTTKLRFRLRQFASLRTLVKGDIDREYKRYIKNIETNIKINPKLIWGNVKSKKNTRNVIQRIVNGNTLLEDAGDIANAFAESFTSVFDNLSANFNADSSELIHTSDTLSF